VNDGGQVITNRNFHRKYYGHKKGYGEEARKKSDFSADLDLQMLKAL
jgi:hypothetical protein